MLLIYLFVYLHIYILKFEYIQYHALTCIKNSIFFQYPPLPTTVVCAKNDTRTHRSQCLDRTIFDCWLLGSPRFTNIWRQ